MHEKAIERMKEQITELLNNANIQEGKPIINELWDNLNGICRTALTSKKEWATESGLKIMIYDKISSMLGTLDSENQTQNGLLVDLLDQDRITHLTDDIEELIVNIPRSYELKLPMPSPPSDFTESIELATNISLVFEDAPTSGLRQSLLGLSGGGRKLFLSLNLSGFCDFSLDSATPRKALTAYKVIIQQGLFHKIFKLNDNVTQGLLGLAGYGQHNIPKSSLSISDLTNGYHNYTVSFPLSLCSLINKLEFEDTDGDTVSKLRRLLTVPVILINSEKEGAERVRAAIEWLFDSMASDTDTLSFLQICFGLEALLGEGDSDQGLTKTLADRCAYLVARSIDERRHIKERFRDLYQIRSNLVHGTNRQLDEEEKDFYYWGKNILEYAIYREIVHLKLIETVQ